MITKPRQQLLIAIFALLLLTPGFTTAQRVATGESCFYHGDCEAGLVCNGRKCQMQCRTNEDCAPDEMCVIDPQPRGVPTTYAKAWNACVKKSAYAFPMGYQLEEVPMENTNILGGDYAVHALADNDPTLCYNLCKQVSHPNNTRCNAWSFVRSGVQGPVPYCWLKEITTGTPNRVHDTNCVSGVIALPIAVPIR